MVASRGNLAPYRAFKPSENEGFQSPQDRFAAGMFCPAWGYNSAQDVSAEEAEDLWEALTRKLSGSLQLMQRSVDKITGASP
jgi:hypothetical protein